MNERFVVVVGLATVLAGCGAGADGGLDGWTGPTGPTTSSPFGAGFPSWESHVCDHEPPGNWSGQRPS